MTTEVLLINIDPLSVTVELKTPQALLNVNDNIFTFYLTIPGI